MKGSFFRMAGLVLAMLCSGCLPVQQGANLQRDMDETKRRLAYLERRVTSESLDIKDETGRNLTTVIQKQANLQADIDNLRVEMQSLKGRVEDVSQQNARLREELALLRDQMVLKTSDLETKLKQAAGGTSSAKALLPAASPAPETASPEELYKKGLELVREKGDFGEGRQLFKRFLAASPQHPLAPNAMYWIGEAYYGEKDYESAVLQFQEVLQKYPQHPKAPASLLKQGLAFQAMGEVKNALILFDQVAASFPKSPEAQMAAKKAAELKKR
ncbi:MAG: tol-pal system protein YbgF [Deltaproteobacteria bacterium]|nr:tol-pal system protein YbgF [Deltaproteobacteria bacterium]